MSSVDAVFVLCLPFQPFGQSPWPRTPNHSFTSGWNHNRTQTGCKFETHGSFILNDINNRGIRRCSMLQPL